MPEIACYLNAPSEPIGSGHPLWNQPLPDNRDGTQASGNPVTYREYFNAVIDFCAADRWALIVRAAARRLGHAIVRSALDTVSIYLEKHGAFYHPARLQVMIGGRPLAFVVNVAISAAGNATLPREVEALSRLNARCPFGWLPDVYGNTSRTLPDGGTLSMFLGSWFERYYEIHRTRSAGTGADAAIVWDGAETPVFLDERQMAEFYRQAAMILTTCFDPLSTAQIFPWHHAAGDFVVGLDKDRVCVRLITVRGYVPMIGVAAEIDDERTLLDALAMFLIHLTLRMRLDRLDGIGDLVWAPDTALRPTMDGFFQGLDLTARLSGLPESVADTFRIYVHRCPAERLADMAAVVVDRFFPPDSGEQATILANLTSHLSALRHYMGE
jgi:hypothetical protein